MEGSVSFADELYSESLQVSKGQVGRSSTDDLDRVELSHEDESWVASEDELDERSEREKEWKKRHDRFHTEGYRDGIIAGKEASSQEGFNIGFRQSIVVGYNWGLVRGVTSALACLPDGLREKLIETEEKRTGFQGLLESVQSLSTTDALRLFNDEIIARKARENENADTVSPEAGFPEQISDVTGLGNHFAQLRLLLVESPAINVHLP